jgi:cytochrome P450
VSNAILAIVAGSDTSATTLAICFYYLLRNPEIYKRLQEEIDRAVPEGETRPDPAVLQNLPFLNAVM